MSTATKSTKQKEKKAAAPAKYATVEQFDELAGMMKQIVTVVSDLKGKVKTPEDVKEEKTIASAGPDRQKGATPMPQEWEDTAREIIGEAVDHCEMLQPKGGGTLFTVVIKPEFSNASPEYLERYKVDRRTKEIGSEGLSGVEVWCKLIKQNLKRGR